MLTQYLNGFLCISVEIVHTCQKKSFCKIFLSETKSTINTKKCSSFGPVCYFIFLDARKIATIILKLEVGRLQ